MLERLATFFFRLFFPSALWRVRNVDNAIFLTFDDGPTREATDFVLAELAKHQAKATFFCIGDNVRKNQDVYQKVLAAGHAVGNHTYHHKNGWKTSYDDYLSDVARCRETINSTLFRPPYGRLTWRQFQGLKKSYRLVMWDVLSYDFKLDMTANVCIERVLLAAKPGSIIVFHDSEKCFPLLKQVLPTILAAFHEKGWQMLSLPDRVHA